MPEHDANLGKQYNNRRYDVIILELYAVVYKPSIAPQKNVMNAK